MAWLSNGHVTPIHLEHNISKTTGDTPFHRTTNRKWHMGYPKVTWPTTSRDPKRCCKAVRSAILATAWLFVFIVAKWWLSVTLLFELTLNFNNSAPLSDRRARGYFTFGPRVYYKMVDGYVCYVYTYVRSRISLCICVFAMSCTRDTAFRITLQWSAAFIQQIINQTANHFT